MAYTIPSFNSCDFAFASSVSISSYNAANFSFSDSGAPTKNFTAGAAISKLNIPHTALIGAVIQYRFNKVSQFSSAIAGNRLITSNFGAANLAVPKFKTSGMDFKVRGIEYSLLNCLTQKTFSRSVKSNSLCSVVGITKTTDFGSLFSSLMRSYSGAAVQGTVSLSAYPSGAIQGIGLSLSSSFNVMLMMNGDNILSYPAYFSSVIQREDNQSSTFDTYLAKFRVKNPRAGSCIGVNRSLSGAMAGMVSKSQAKTPSSGAVLQATQSRPISNGAAVTKIDMPRSTGAGAYLIAYAADVPVTASDDGGEWIPTDRTIEFFPSARSVDWTATGRGTEWMSIE